MQDGVKIGARVPAGREGVELFLKLKLGNVPLEAPGAVLARYGPLVFLGWNTMTAAPATSRR
jgi:hypothetical protein